MALRSRHRRLILCLLIWTTLSCVIQTTKGATIEEKIPEGRPRNSVVYSFTSSSGDIYSFYKPQDSVSADALRYFHISENGVVTTAKILTFTIGDSNKYELTVLQRPSGATEGGIAHTLKISVEDINNFPPTFAFPVYDGRVAEGSPENTVVDNLQKFHAEDRDVSGIKAYRIISGNERNYFQASTKTVGTRQFLELKTTSTPIVRDPNAPYITLTIEAEDGGNPTLFGSTKVKIQIEDSNNNAPKFEQNQYSIDIAENTPLMTKFMRVKAIEKDVGANGGIYYFMDPLDEYFSVDAITGDIKVVRELDYSVKSSYPLTIFARDRGYPAKTSSPATVTIGLSKDISGYPPPDTPDPGKNTKPYFAYPKYTFTIREDFPVKAALLAVRSSDNDPVGPNKRLRYSLSGSDKFIIDPNSGIVTLNKAVDYETENKKYTLTITATDQGSPTLSATTQLVIDIQDVDENHFSPKFASKQAAVSIAENLANNSLVYQSSATDGDSGSNGKIVYYLEEGSGLGYFNIDPDSGKVTVAALLDREKQSQYELIITAIDSATFPRSSSMFLMIMITDVNDNYPYFTEPIYLADVPEKSLENTFVTVISARDPDSDSQGISYGLVDNSKNFKVDPQTGVVRTARSLDGSVRRFELSVTASKGDTISGQINVTVTSKADKPPVFKNIASYHANIPENMGIVPNLMCIAAVDSNSKEVKYKIASGADNVFGLDATSGRLYSLRSFDYEDVDRYNLRIEASSGSSKEVESTPVSITVTGEPDTPEFSKSTFSISVREDTSVGTTIRSVIMSIVDSDTSADQFDCSIEKVISLQTIEHFGIVQSQGGCLLVLKKALDSYDTKSFKFEVTATDRAFKHMSAKAAVTVTVQDGNDHSPVFSKSSYWVSVPRSTQKDRKILDFVAVDRDTGTNADVLYDLTPASPRFKIRNGNEMFSASSLSPNVRYQLLVKASDSASKPRTSSVTVYVSVYDASESPIVFGKPKYSTSLAENDAKNKKVFKVSALKAGSSSGIKYELVGGHMTLSGAKVFTIDSSGQVLLNLALDREDINSYKLFIRAKHTGGKVAMATDVEGIVTITDVNDNLPKFGFVGNSKVVTIENYTPTGAVIIRAIAFDPDEGPNGELTYSIVSGKSTANHPFQIDSKTGDVKASREIRYQPGSTTYNVVVKATAGSSSTEFTLKIEVVNTPRPPTFKEQKYEFTVSETADPGSTVNSIKAVYSKANAFLKYTIIGGNRDNAFCINGQGTISVARSLDRERVPTYLLRVRVELGSNKHETIVTINLLDINDDPPHFKMNSYTLSVEENTIKNLLPILSAVDHDSDKNGELSYEILQSVETASKSMFSINDKTGQLSIKKKLDYEKAHKHVLFIRARDNGSPRYSAIARVTINVIDENDEYPVFATSLYRGKVALDANVGKSVIQVRASDLDSSSNGEIKYLLIKGNEEEGFKINNQGVISVNKPLTTVEADKFEITVEATDKGTVPKKGYTKVKINVFLPDGPPKFVVSPVIVNVTEGIPANSRVAGVKAATSEALTYSIISGNTDGMFTINPSTGQLDATRTLDYEEKQQHVVQIEARDTRDRSAAVTLIINVININDNKPMFPGEEGGQIDRKAIGICDPTDIGTGQVVTNLGAVDKDKGDKITYELGPDGSKYFEVDPNGVLRAKEPLDSLPSPYKFSVKAKDDGEPPQENEVNVRLVFLHYNPDQDPVRVKVPEDTKVGSIIAKVPRYFPNGTIQLLFPEKANFSIRDNGDVVLLTPLDYETKRFHSITVREKDSIGSMTNDVDVEITVLDVNDNRPIFIKKSRIGTVNTNSRAGAAVYQLNAEDKDGGSSGLVGYQLEAPETNKRRKRRSLPQSPFTINPNTKQLEVAGPLGDKRYDLPVYAFDYGIPRLKSNDIKLNIDASKAGQLAPRFTKVSYRFNVSEDAGYLHLVGTVKARSISGSRLDYSIEAAGNTGNKFKALENGNIVVNSLLDLENHPAMFSLKVKAMEQIPDGLSSIVDVRIDVINANDHVPYFDQMLYSTTEVENVGVGKIIYEVKAYDCDCIPNCNCGRGVLKYSIQPSKEQGGKFFIDEESGKISVSSMLDYETKKRHMLKITASDTGKKVYKGICFLNVTIKNSNDNIPLFTKIAYDFYIAEQAAPNIPLAVVQAVDADGDTVSYTKLSGSNFFSVAPKTGVITLNKKITSSKTQHSMQIQARDPGNLFSTVNVVIHVIDANDNAPVFTTCPNSKPVTILENLPAGHRVFQVIATDKDRGKNGQIEYSIVDAQSLSLFKIDKRTGEIRTITSLDRESKKNSYTTIIKAEDGTDSQLPEERLLSYCFLRIDISDANDNRPYFAEIHYYGSVQNTALNGTAILTVQATDNDVGSNAKVKYALTNSEGGLFAIHPSTGQVTVNGDLKKYTVKKTIDLTVSARDEQPRAGEQPGQNTRYSTSIEVVVTPNPPPKFTQQVYKGQVQEGVDTGTSVLKISATTSSGIIRYIAVNTNPRAHELFRISADTGIISTGSQINYEVGHTYEMHFMAKETVNTLYSTCKVIITVIDVNDERPIFELGVNTDARVLEGVDPGEKVIDNVAYDKDTGAGGKITYFLKKKPDPNFQINTNTGLITTKKKLDREKNPKYDVIIVARDGGNLKQEATVFITVVDQNDQHPVFKPKIYTGSTPEDSPVRTSVLSVYASDKDVGDNAKLTYFISGGDPEGKFAVETKNDQGILVVNGKLDYESVAKYDLLITATDGKHTDTAKVTVTITDVNDLPPVFSQPLYKSVIQEKTKPNVAVTTVTASDIDGPFVSFSLDDRGKGYFDIVTKRVGNTKTFVGEIKTGSTELDRETSPVKIFSVIASDGKHKTTAVVMVNLTDVNDQNPRFPSSPYIGYVRENLPTGTSVMYIQAVDDDDPFTNGNAKIKYELTDSAGGKFKIDPVTGLITTLAEFDRETPPDRYKVKVKATDSGNPKLSGDVDATIIITDDNDWAPAFTEKLYRGTVSERAPPAYRVTSVSATDKDIGPNAELEFVVIDGNFPQAFYVDPYNGTVLVSGILDYEKKNSYRMTVEVYDRGMPPKKGKDVAYVEITITDANDNAPVFIPKEYNKTVPENHPIGEEVLRVTAIDEDSGTNGNITFTITGGNEDDIFVIEPDPKNGSIGIIKTRLPIDRESIPKHHLVVTATDPGGLTGKGDVWLTIKDVNDNGPWFVPPFYVGKVKENTDKRQFVTRVSAIDPDEYVPGQSVAFSLVNGTSGKNFRLDPGSFTNDSANVYAYGLFDREDQSTWKIGILATESNVPKNTNFTYIYVDVEDENDKEPNDGSLRIIVNAYNGSFKGGIIGKPYYKDDDFDGDKNIYKLDSQSPGSYFAANENTGDITAQKHIPLGNYKLKFAITESSSSSGPRKNDMNFPKTVASTIDVLVRRIDPVAVGNSVAMQFIDMRKVGYFVGDFHDKFVSTVADILGTSSDDVEVFSIQKAPDRIVSLNVFFAVSSGDGEYVPSLDVINAIVKKESSLKDLGLKIGAIGIDECAKEKHKVGKCTNLVKASPAYSVASGDYGKVPAPSSSLTIVSMDVLLKANYTHIFPSIKRCRPQNPCLHGGTCFTTVPECPGYVCKCPPGYHGPRCELTTRTFHGNSYIWLPKLTAYEMSEIEFDFITLTPDGLLLYQGPLDKGSNNGAKDFIAVPLVNGRIQLHLSLGHEPVVINMDKGPRLDDGEWHTVHVSRRRKEVEIIIDRCSTAVLVRKEAGRIEENREYCQVHGRVLGRSVYLDGFGPLQIGGVSNPDLEYPKIPYKGFKGCIRNIEDNNVMYDLKKPLRVVNAPEGCELAKPCPNCNGKGYCEPLLARNSICVCNAGYGGKNCDGRGKASFYLGNSFTQYLVKTSRRKRRELIPPPTSLLNKHYTSITLHVKIEPDAANVVVFLASNHMGTEFQRVDVKDHKLRYIIRLGNRMLVLTFPQLNITDNVYHTVVVRRQGNRATMQLDYRGYQLGSTRGERTLLDMGGGALFAGGLPNVTVVRIVEAILLHDGNIISPDSTDVAFGTSFGSGVSANLERISDSAGFAAAANNVKGVSLKNLHVSSSDGDAEGQSRRSKREAPVSVLGDFGGCIAGANVNGADLESEPSIVVKRQNVVSGCPCLANHCLHGGTCVNAMPPYCICPTGWTGPRCETIVTQPNPGQRAVSRWMHPAVIAMILVILIAILVIMAAVLIKKRPVVAPVVVTDHEEGHVHDNVRLYHEEGGGEEDNFGFDITKLMKYTYIETTIPPRHLDSRITEGDVDEPESAPLLKSGPPPSSGPVFGLTGGPGPKAPKYTEGDDIGDFITTRVTITNREVYLAVDELHIYRYEGDDSDVDDLSEIEDEDEDDEYEQEFDFLKQWGTKFDKLSKMYDGIDD